MRIILTLSVIFLATNCFSQQNNEAAIEAYVAAEKYYESSKLDSSLIYLNKAEALLGETNPRILALYVRVYNRKGNEEKMQDYLNQYFTLASKEDVMYGSMSELKDKLTAQKEGTEAAKIAASKPIVKSANNSINKRVKRKPIAVIGGAFFLISGVSGLMGGVIDNATWGFEPISLIAYGGGALFTTLGILSLRKPKSVNIDLGFQKVNNIGLRKASIPSVKLNYAF